MAISNTNNTTSTAAYSYLQFNNKISGLVSGIDVNSVMEKLMKAENAQMEKLQQQKQKSEWQRDAYRDVNLKLNTFRTDLFDKFGLSSSWTSKTVNSVSPKVNVTASSTANGTLNISNATTAKAASSNVGAAQTGALTNQRINGNTTLSNIEGLAISASGNTTLNFMVNGENKSLNVNATTTLDQLTNQLNDLKVTVDGEEKQVMKASISNGKINVVSNQGSIKSTDAATNNFFNSLGMLNNSTSLGEAVKYQNDENETVAINKETKLSDMGLAPTGTLTFNVGDQVKTVNYTADDDTLEKLFKKINVESTDNNKTDPRLNASVNANGQISISSTLGPVTLVDSDARNKLGFVDKVQTGKQMFETSSTQLGMEKTQGSTLLKELGFGTEGIFTIRAIQEDGSMKDTEVKYSPTDTINSLMSRISNSGAGVTAIFNNGQMSISASNTGAAENNKAEVSLLADNAEAVNLFAKLGASSSATDGEIALADGGTNSSLTVNGVEYTGTSNNYSISGYSIQLNSDVTAADNVTISSNSNVQGTVDKVKDFVGMYNTLIESLNKQKSEKKNVSFNPLTEAQKSAMSEDEIKKWEEKSKSGLLRNDQSITTVLSKMRSILGSGSGLNTLANLGITTSSTWTDNGKLIVDEKKLKESIEKDPDLLANIFAGSEGQEGMISQIRKAASTAISNIEKTAGKASSVDNQFSIGRTIISLDDKIENWKDRLKGIEERYWKQFSAMEAAVQKANSQSSIFSA